MDEGEGGTEDAEKDVTKINKREKQEDRGEEINRETQREK